MRENQFNRTPVYIALGLAIVLVVGVLVGARLVSDRSRQVQLSAVPAPQAESQECSALLDDLPTTVAGLRRATLVDPVPPGAAAWSLGDNRVTLRCGVSLPEQYTELSRTADVAGVEWVKVADPGTDLATWYTVDREPVVAVTAEGQDPTGDVSPAIAQLPEKQWKPFALPLSDLATPEAQRCTGFMGALPKNLGDNPLVRSEGTRAVWAAEDHAPIVVACGVEQPADYAAGARLTQVNNVPWFVGQDGYFALGRQALVAVSMPPEATDELLEITNLIEKTIPPVQSAP
ncbi:DUF3515 family protein [Corynebacterium renale]|uniref:Uncharacterized protein DUF3515 n=1 Tax=Corynebacterium renale TaxID=1724 RepID=A0A2A9DPY8_9CORY|nr:DUF3515 family protein [Corynebacterium renale]PFG28827.1 uncharacterized protein DUF3515 [Corynebacterium renale]SQI25685.1 putative secreted protein [Corynebacterium renale]